MENQSTAINKEKGASGTGLWSFLLVFFILILLIGAILFTNLYTNRTISNLQTNTLEASGTFRTNAILQEIVNQTNQVDLSIRKRLIEKKSTPESAQALADSIHAIRQNISEIKSLASDPSRGSDSRVFYRLMEQRLSMLDRLLSDLKLGTVSRSYYLNEKEKALNDSIYNYALQIQRNLEIDLSESMQEGINLSLEISKLSQGFSIFVVLAFAALGTFLIKRLLKHDTLIRELKISQQQTEALAKAKEEFLANMSHEIRTPLHAIIGYTDLLKGSSLSEKQKKQVDILGNAGDQLYSGVNDILDVAKLEDGKLRIENKPFNVSKLLAELELFFQHSASDKGLALRVSTDKKIPEMVVGDPVRLRQILYNLINNAIKFTHRGFVHITAKLKEQKDAVSTVVFIVSDSGIGIDKSFHETVFNRFEQVPGSGDNNATRLKGTGLGLSIVKGIVGLLKGKVTLESEPQVGSTFTIELPFLAAEENQQIDVTTASLSGDGFDFSGVRILVAEDNQVNQFLIELLFEKWGVEWSLANNGLEAIQILEGDKDFDMIFLDLRMPVMSGEEALAKIRNQLGLKIPVIAMTAHVQNETGVALIDSGFTDWLNKPFYSEKLAAKIIANAQPGSTFKLAGSGNHSGGNAGNGLPIEVQRKVMQLFAEHFPPAFDELRVSIQTNDYVHAREVAHKLAGTAAAFGAHSPLLDQLNMLRDLIRLPANATTIQKAWRELEELSKAYVDEANQQAGVGA